jgi:hypothetical protein
MEGLIQSDNRNLLAVLHICDETLGMWRAINAFAIMSTAPHPQDGHSYEREAITKVSATSH